MVPNMESLWSIKSRAFLAAFLLGIFLPFVCFPVVVQKISTSYIPRSLTALDKIESVTVVIARDIGKETQSHRARTKLGPRCRTVLG